MSRIGKKVIPVPEQVKIEIKNNTVNMEGPKGKLSYTLHPRISVELKDGLITVKRATELKLDKSLHGTMRAILANMIHGVSQGYEKQLEIVGVGFRAQVQGSKLEMQIGFTHPVIFNSPEGIKLETPNLTHITIKGVDKAKVGEVAAKIRDFLPPEPYKGKGIRYVDEKVRKKIGKAVTK